MAVGGVEKKIINLLNRLDKNKFQFQLALFNKEGQFLNQVPKKIEISGLGYSGKFGLLRVIFSLKKIIDIDKPDRVLSFGNYPNTITIFTKIISKENPMLILGVGNLMSQWVKYQKLPYARILSIKLLYPYADKIIAVSKAVKKDLVENFSISESKIEVVYNAQQYSKRRVTKSLRKPKISTLLFAGRLVKQKRVDFLLKALAHISKRKKVQLRIFGEGQEKENLIALSKKLKLEDSVEFNNFRLDIEKEIAKADLLVHTSTIEGHPNLIIESMVIGTPILVTRYPGAEELVKNGVNGFLVPRDVTPEKLGNKIVYLLNNSEMLGKVSQNAQKLPKRFISEYQTKRYEKILEN